MSNYIEDNKQMPTKMLQTAQDYFAQSAAVYEASHNEAELTLNMYDDNHYTNEQILQLQNEGRPIETYNIVKKYTRNLVGYMSTIVTDINIRPRSFEATAQAQLRDSIVKYVLDVNKWDRMQDDLVKNAALAGLVTLKYAVVNTGNKDSVGRDITEMHIEVIPSKHILPDPLDKTYDYSNNRYTHEWQWLPAAEIKRLFGSRKLKKLRANADNNLDFPLAGFEYNYIGLDQGKFKKHDHYLVVRTVMKYKGKLMDLYWIGSELLHSQELQYNPYRCFKLHSGESKPEFYGMFREILETQKAINQAVLQIQLLVNSDKVFVDTDAIDGSISEFTAAYNRVNAVIPMLDLDGFKVENLNPDIVAQYTILDAAIQRVQALLGINDSFLGLAAASDSGRKVMLQQNSSVVAMRYFTRFIEFVYEALGMDIVHITQKYYKAHQKFSLATDMGQDTWLEINKPFLMPKDNLNHFNEIEYEVYRTVELDDNGELQMDEDNSLVTSVVNEPETDVAQPIDIQVKVKTSAYGESAEMEKVFLESMLNGNPGVFMQQAQPAAYAKLIEVYAKAIKSEHSPDIVQLAQGLQEALGGLPMADPRETATGQGQGLQQGNMAGNTGALTQALGVNNDLAKEGYNAKKGQ